MIKTTVLGSALLALAASACTVTTSTSTTTEPTPGETTPAETPAAPDNTGGGGGCTSDADCVPAACCHASACVIRDEAPSCADTMCTQECRFGTLDCGGQCLCQEGQCVAQLSQPPTP